MIEVRVKFAGSSGKSDENLGTHKFFELPRVGDTIQFTGRIVYDGGFRSGGRHAFKVVQVYHWAAESMLTDERVREDSGRPYVCLFVEPGTMKNVD